MGYKMKGPSLYRHLTTKPRLSEELNVNHDSKDHVKDGRSKSSAFQMREDGGKKTKEQLLSEGFTPADADRMRADGAVTGKQPSKHALFSKLSASEKKAYNALSPKERANVDKNKELHQLKNALGPKPEYDNE